MVNNLLFLLDYFSSNFCHSDLFSLLSIRSIRGGGVSVSRFFGLEPRHAA